MAPIFSIAGAGFKKEHWPYYTLILIIALIICFAIWYMNKEPYTFVSGGMKDIRMGWDELSSQTIEPTNKGVATPFPDVINTKKKTPKPMMENFETIGVEIRPTKKENFSNENQWVKVVDKIAKVK